MAATPCACYEENLLEGFIDDSWCVETAVTVMRCSGCDRGGSEVQFIDLPGLFGGGIWWELLLRYLYLGLSDFICQQILGHFVDLDLVHVFSTVVSIDIQGLRHVTHFTSSACLVVYV